MRYCFSPFIVSNHHTEPEQEMPKHYQDINGVVFLTAMPGSKYQTSVRLHLLEVTKAKTSLQLAPGWWLGWAWASLVSHLQGPSCRPGPLGAALPQGSLPWLWGWWGVSGAGSEHPSCSLHHTLFGCSVRSSLQRHGLPQSCNLGPRRLWWCSALMKHLPAGWLAPLETTRFVSLC